MICDFCKNLMEYKSYIKIFDLEIDSIYYCLSEKFEYGKWDGKKFLYRKKGDNGYEIRSAFHWDNHGTTKPIKKIEDEIIIGKLLEYFNVKKIKK